VLEKPTVARGGDRFVLRSYSPVTTIGGGRVLDPDPPRKTVWPVELAAADPAARLTALVARRPAGMEQASVSLLLGLPADAASVPSGEGTTIRALAGRLLAGDRVAALEQTALDLVRRFHHGRGAEPGLSTETLRRALRVQPAIVEELLAGLVREGRLVLAGGVASLPGFQPAPAPAAAELDRIASALEQAGLAPPSVPELEQQLGVPSLRPALRLAASRGLAVAVERDRYFSPKALQQFLTTVREVAASGEITPPRLRERLGLSRKYLIPLLEWADRTGVTRRVGETRVLVGGNTRGAR
jgi:selenocysteine-specific elongation factor